MKCPHSTERERQERPHDSLASSHEIKSVFAEQRDYLHWISLVITGNDAIAEQAMLNANDLSASWSGVFRDWLIEWANHITVRASVRAVHDLISASAKRYSGSSCETSDYDVLSVVLSQDQIASLRQVDPRDIIAAHSTIWPVPRWCFGEYNMPPLPIARFCWTCPATLFLTHTARLSDGTASVPVPI